jgi:hypothetical protein
MNNIVGVFLKYTEVFLVYLKFFLKNTSKYFKNTKISKIYFKKFFEIL